MLDRVDASVSRETKELALAPRAMQSNSRCCRGHASEQRVFIRINSPTRVSPSANQCNIIM